MPTLLHCNTGPMSNRGPIDLVIFDCDGVLVDSEVLFNCIAAEEFTRCGVPV